MKEASGSTELTTRDSARGSVRFERKRALILDAATRIINQNGARGATLQEVARAVGLNTPGVTYYFPRKEGLAKEVFTRSIQRLHDMACEAASAATAKARVYRFLQLSVAQRAAVIRGEGLPIASLADIRTLDDAAQTELNERYLSFFRIVRHFFGEGPGDPAKRLNTARAHMLLEAVFWLPAWLPRYALSDFDRVTDRIFAVLEHGLAAPGAIWGPTPIKEEELEQERTETETVGAPFIKAATILINERGYHGASVARIAETLNVTKGSFYHHLAAKDDLVLECFRQSYKRIAVVQSIAHLRAQSQWESLTDSLATLIDLQFTGAWPLTRTTALQALPANLRAEVVRRSDRTALRWMGTLIEGQQEGSIRQLDPLIASQLIISTLNAAFDLRNWASGQPLHHAVARYASTIMYGLFEDANHGSCG